MPYTQADLVDRVLARLGEVGFGLGSDPNGASAYTNEDLVQRILVRLGEVGFGQGAEPEAADRVRGPLPGILAELAVDRIFVATAAGMIQPEAMDALSAFIASRLSDDFGLPADAVTLLAQRGLSAQAKLERLRFGYQDRATKAIPGILAELYADRIYAFPVEDTIRPEAFESLSAICASRLAGEFNVAADRLPVLLSEAQAAEPRLRRMRAQPSLPEPVRTCYF